MAEEEKEDFSIGNGSESEYFASLPAEELTPVLKKKADEWFDTLTSNAYLDKVKRAWQAYHGAYFDDLDGGHAIKFGGEQGELVNLPVNHFRNLAEHILVMITANRPNFRARSTNTDAKSKIQTNLANSLLDYYMREKRLEKYLHRAANYAVVMGSGFIKMEWNSMSGIIHDYNEETKTPIYEGDAKFKNLSVYDVAFDTTKEDVKELDWIIARTWKNQYDLAAANPELKEEILKLKTKSELNQYRFSGSNRQESSDVAVYEFFHVRSESMPDGRYFVYLDDDIALSDSPMPYRELPVYRISPADILGTPFGYTSMFDFLPIQDALNSLYSTILTNQNAFGVQNVLNPRGSDIVVNQLQGGLNVIDYNAAAGKPESLNLTDTPKEVFTFIEMLERVGETLTGVNAVARGNPQASLESGNALALIQAQALEFISGFQQQYIHLIEDVGTGLINMLKDFASAPRLAAIVGKSNRSEMTEFSGDDLSMVNRVHVDVSNALSNTTAGKVQMAEQMLQMYGDKLPPEQYISVMETGKLEFLTSGLSDQNTLVSVENERLVDGNSKILVADTDDHAFHIKEHRNVLNDPELRLDANLVGRTLAHIKEHIEALRTVDPDILAITMQKPLGPEGGSPVSPENASGGGMNQQGMGGMAAQPSPEEAAQFANNNNSLPSLPQPAAAPGGAPTQASDIPLQSNFEDGGIVRNAENLKDVDKRLKFEQSKFFPDKNRIDFLQNMLEAYKK
jgi:hypothetical protein